MAEIKEADKPGFETFRDFTDSEGKTYQIRPAVITFDDVVKMAPSLRNHRKLVESVLKFLMIDRVNEVHARYSDTPGIPFSNALIDDEFHIRTVVDNEDVLDRFRTGSFVTVSNHPYGSVDGILLLHVIGRHRPDYKLMVNMILNNLSAMRPNFIAVDPFSNPDPAKRMVSVDGIREAMQRIRDGHPVGFFPAGAVSKIQKNLRIADRQWQPTILRLIQKMRVPVIPVYFHGHNSVLFNILGLISWKIRTLRLPAEVFDKRDKTIRMSIGEPVSVEAQRACTSYEELGKLLRDATYSLASIKR